jgi:Uma2 family endonuclease
MMALPNPIPPTATTPPATAAPRVPLLETGDHLSREEFERRYQGLPHVKKAELIEGVVHMPSPVRARQHGGPHAQLSGCLVVYQAFTPGVFVVDNTTLRLDLENEPQPDVALLIEPACGGQARLSADDYIEGAPELVAEVAASSVSIDLNTKLRVYRRNGVREYLVWRVQDAAFDWFALRQGQYERLTPDTAGVCRSENFAGLWLDVNALLRGDLARVLGVLQEGLGSPKHAEFVDRLRSAAGRNS